MELISFNNLVDTNTKKNARAQDKSLGHDIAFGLQHSLICLATDFLDPFISKWFQSKHGDHHHAVTHKHTIGGELAGDGGGFLAYLFIKRIFSAPVANLTAATQKMLDPLYMQWGKKSLKPWMKAENIAVDSPEYQEKLENYKNFQASNLVDSSIIAAASTITNVAAQRALGNKQTYAVILTSKLIGTALTLGSMLGMRAALPTSTQTIDNELNERYFSKIIHHVRKLFGDDTQDQKKDYIPDTYIGHQNLFSAAPIIDSNLEGEPRKAAINMLAQHAQGLNLQNPVILEKFIAEEKELISAMLDIFSPEGVFAQTLAKKHYDIICQLHGLKHNSTNLGAAELLQEASKESIQSIILNRRDDLFATRKLLNDMTAISELKDLNITGAPHNNSPLSQEKKEKLIESLLLAKNNAKAEPAVHIYATAKGQLIEHQALSFCFDPENNVTQILAEELQKRLPQFAQDKLSSIAKNYMSARQAAAIKIVDAFQLDSDIATQAIERSEAIRTRHKIGSNPQISIN